MQISFKDFMDEVIFEVEQAYYQEAKSHLRAGLDGYLTICAAVQKDFSVPHVDLVAVDGDMVIFAARTADGDDILLVSMDELIEICEDYKED